jgi:hypothetical protein
MIALIRVLVMQVLGNAAIRGLAMKYFLKGLIMLAIPVAIFAGLNMFMGAIVDWSIEKMAVTDAPTMSSQLPGLAVYLWVTLGLDVMLSVMVGAWSTKMVIRSIPFLRL